MEKFSAYLLCLLSSSSLFGTTATWNLNAAGDWNVNGNWTPSTFPNAINDIANFLNVITAPRTVSLGTGAQNITIGSLNIDSGQAYTIQSGLAGNTLIFDVSAGSAALNVTTINGSATHSITTPITLNDTLSVATSTPTTTILGSIQGLGGITKTGTGQLEFSGTSSNTYTGLTTLSAGTLLLNKTTGLNAIAGNAMLNGGSLLLGAADQISNTSTVTISGSTWNLQGFAETIATLNFNAGTLTQGGATLTLGSAGTALSMRNRNIAGPIALTGGGSIAFDPSSNGTATISGAIDLGGNITTFNIANGSAITDMNVTGIISNGGITKIGTGQLRLSGNFSNTYMGLTTISEGELALFKLGGSIAIAGDVHIDGGSLLLAAGSASDQIANTSTVTISSGTWDLESNAETIAKLDFQGGTLTQGGAMLTLESAGTALSMRNTSIAGPLFFPFGGSIVFDAASNGTATISGSLLFASTIHTFDIANGSAATDMNVSGDIVDGGITKIGTGQLEFSGASPNSYGGLTTISEGNLLLNKTAGVNAIAGDVQVNGGNLLLGDADQIADGSTVTISSGTWDLQGFAETIARLDFEGGTLTQGGGVLSLAGGGLSMRNTSIAGPIALTGGGTIAFVATNNGTATISGPIDLGANTITFNIADGSASTDMDVSGIISNGGIVTEGTGRLEFSGSSPNTYTDLTEITFGDFGDLFLNKTAGVNAIAGDVLLEGGNLTLGAADQIADSSTVTLAGGTWDLQGFAETIATLDFEGGTLTQGGGVLSLASAGTALFMQDTSIAGPITLTGGGAIAFVAANNGTATISGTIDLGANTTTFDIADGSASTDMDVSGIISNGGITKIGTGRLEFSGASPNTYTGLTDIQFGDLFLNKTAGVNAIAGDVHVNGGNLLLGAADQIVDTSAVIITNGTWDLQGFAETIATLDFEGGTLTQGGGVLSLASAGTALFMQNTSIAGPIALTGGGAIAFVAANNGTATISGTIDLGTNTTTFDIADGSASTDMDVSGIISNGGITKIGTGRLEFSGASPNTYTGLTDIQFGDLFLNKTAGVNAIAGDVHVNGGNLLLGAANQIADSSTVTLTSGTWDLQGFAETIATLDFEGGTLTQGGGVLSLASAGTALSMKNTSIAGPIALTGGGAIAFVAANNGTAMISGTIDLGTNTTTFDIADGSASTDMDVSGIISNGGLNKTGLGTLVLTGANTYSGGTLVSMGTLQGNTTSLQGNITDNATLVFDQTSTGTYSDQISGTGALIKQGSGTVILSNVNSVGGTTTVSVGSLAVNGSLGGAGTLIVSPGATLQGTGTISKDSFISGVLAPGNSIGTIHFIGAETLMAGSTLEIELNPATADLVDIVGTLSIQPGANLHILPDPGHYPSTFLYTIVQTSGGVTGTFSSVTSALPLFAGSVTYTPLDVLLEISVIPFGTIIPGGNAGAVAKCLDQLAATPCSNQLAVIASLHTIPTEKELKEALLQMQPSAFTSLAVVQENDLSYLRNTLYNRMETKLHPYCCDNSPENDVKNNKISIKRERNLTLWLTALGAHTKQNNHREEPGFKADSPGIFLGLDSNFGQKSCLGGGIGYTHTHMHWSQKRGKADVQGGYGTIYGRWASPHAYMQGSLIGGYSFYSTYRNIAFGTGITAIKETAKGHHDGMEGSVHLKTGFNYGCRYITFSPFIGCDYFYVHENSFHEHGAESLNLKVKSKNADLLSSEAGIDLSHCFGQAKKSFTPFVKLSVIRESRFKGQKEKASFECGCDFSVSGLYPSRTLAGVALGFSANALTKALSLFYQGKFGNSYSDNSLYLQYSFKF